MFSTAGYFTKISCPLDESCALPNCLFKHSSRDVERDSISVSDENVVAPRTSALERNKPSRRSSLGNGIDLGKGRNGTPSQVPERSEPQRSSKRFRPAIEADLPADEGVVHSNKQNTATCHRPISPPPRQKSTTQENSNPIREFLNPRMLKHAPAEHATRTLYLEKLHEEVKRLNTSLETEDQTEALKLKLSDDELIRLALDQEEKIARENPSIYANVVKLRIVAYRKMTADQWKKERLEVLSAARSHSPKSVQNTRPLETELSIEQQVGLLPRLFAVQSGLEPFGYVTSLPSEDEIEMARQGVAAAAGYESCERCQKRFQVYPDRREDGALTGGGKCTYHYGRAIFPPRDKTERITGPNEKIWNCCSQLYSSAGCTIADNHVFKVHDAKRLASIVQFQATPENARVHKQSAICFDCEMGFTVFGMELIRLTATSWPDGEEMLDVLVKPLGTILDLNSRFSGVWPEHFAKALPYTDPQLDSGPTFQEKRLCVVDSPMVARQLLFKLLSPKTPLIGHAIENDLNAIRIVHPSIIDTVLLFPLPAGLPQRPSLKNLVKKFLWKDIQTAGAAGHDSKEDARAAGDMVKLKVIREWKRMEYDGWLYKGDELVPPPHGTESISNVVQEENGVSKRKRAGSASFDHD